MKTALIGYGKMGHAVEKIALSRGHEIVCVIDSGEEAKFSSPEFLSADVAIEFTTPSTAVDNFRRVIGAGIPLVSGTTAWLDRLDEVKAMLKDAPQGLFWTSNFSIGVALFKKIISQATALMDGYPEYRPAMKEIHHIHKLDHPSGTAITLAEGIIAKDNLIKSWSEDDDAADVLRIDHVREGEVPGTHIIKWDSEVDTITIEHCAKSREGFALGAVIAAEWTAGKSGFLTMDQLMHGLIADSHLLDLIK